MGGSKVKAQMKIQLKTDMAYSNSCTFNTMINCNWKVSAAVIPVLKHKKCGKC